MNDIPTITQGCDFTIRISAKRLGINRYVKVSFVEIANISVNLVCLPAIKTPVSCSIDEDGRLIIPISGESLVCNSYGLELLGFYNNGNWRHQIAPAFEIVRTSTEDNYALTESDDLTIDMSIVIGETYTSSRALIGAIDDHNTNPDAHQDIKQAITAAQQAIAIAQQLIEDAQEEIANLQEGLQNAGKVDDVKVDGVSIVDGNKIAQIDSNQFGKVDDVKVNNTSVVVNKVAMVSVPTKLSDLTNDADFATKTEAQQMADAKEITAVEVSVNNTTGEPQATAEVNNGVISINITGIKGENGVPGADGEQGPKGDQGDTVILAENQTYKLYNGATEENTDGAMTQKATVAELNKNGETIWTDILTGSWTTGQYYRESGTTSSSANSSRIAIDVSAYVGKTIKMLVYTGASSGVQRCLFWNGSARVGDAIKVSTANKVTTLVVPTGAQQLLISNVPGTCPNPYVKVSDGIKLAIDVAQENRSAIDNLNRSINGIQANVNKVKAESEGYRQTEVRSCYLYTVRTGYYFNGSGVETANSSYRLVKNIPVEGIAAISSTNNYGSKWHCFDAGGTWLGSVNKVAITAEEMPEGTATLGYSLTATQTLSEITITWDGSKVVSDAFADSMNARKAKLKTLPYQIDNSSGEEAYNESFPSTPFIELKNATGVYCPDIVIASGGIAYYDENKNFISCTLKNNFVKAPNNAKFAKVRIGNKAISSIPETVVTIYGENVSIGDVALLQNKLCQIAPDLKGKKMGVVGDSISSTYGQWIKHLQVMTGVTVCNVAVPGQNYGGGEMAAQARLLDNDCDFVIIFAGTNDYGHNITVGDPIVEVDGVQTPNSDINTTAGGVSKAITDIYATCGTVPIIIMTPMPRVGKSSGDTTCPKNNVGKWLSDYVDCIKKVAEFYSIPVLDLFHNIGIPANIADFRTAFYNDYVHPKPVPTHLLIAKRLYKFLMDNIERW